MGQDKRMPPLKLWHIYIDIYKKKNNSKVVNTLHSFHLSKFSFVLSHTTLLHRTLQTPQKCSIISKHFCSMEGDILLGVSKGESTSWTPHCVRLYKRSSHICVSAHPRSNLKREMELGSHSELDCECTSQEQSEKGDGAGFSEWVGLWVHIPGAIWKGRWSWVLIVSWTVSAHPRSNLKREMELGSHSELDYFLFQVPVAGCSDSCLCDSVPHSCQKSKLLSSQVALHWQGHWQGPHLNSYCSGDSW